MDKETAVNINSSAATDTVVTSTSSTQTEDAEARIAALEAEKSRLIEESANYRLGMLKAKGKIKEENFESEEDDDKMRRIASETLANSRLADIAREQDDLIKRALKENKELKLAQLNRSTATPVAAIGTHSEGQAVQDTLITHDQMAAFKARGWTDKDIERYKKNLRARL